MTALALAPMILASAVPGPLARSLQPYVDRRQIAGAVALVSDRTKALAVETVGYADLERKRPMRPDTVF